MSRLCVRVMSVALVCVCVVTASKAGDDPESPQMIQACGRALVNAIMILCDYQHNYVGPTRSTTDIKKLKDQLSEFRPKTTIHNRRTRRSIVKECCVKSCLVSEMAEYC